MKNNLNEIDIRILELEKLMEINKKKIIKIPKDGDFYIPWGFFISFLITFLLFVYNENVDITILAFIPIFAILIIFLLGILNYLFLKINKILFNDEYFLITKFLFFYHSTNKLENQRAINENEEYLGEIKILKNEKLELISNLYKSIIDRFINEVKVINAYKFLNINLLNSLLNEIDKFEKIILNNNLNSYNSPIEFNYKNKLLTYYGSKDLKEIKNKIEEKLNNKSNYVTQFDIKLIKNIFKSKYDEVNDCIIYYRDEPREHLRYLINYFLNNYVDIKIDNEDYKTVVLFYKKKFEKLKIDVEYYRKKSSYYPRTISINKNPIDIELEKILNENKKPEEENTQQKFNENIDKKSPIENLIKKLNTEIPKVKDLPYNRNHIELEEVLTKIKTIFNNELDLSEDEKDALKDKYIKEWDNYYSNMKDVIINNNEKRYIEAVNIELPHEY